MYDAALDTGPPHGRELLIADTRHSTTSSPDGSLELNHMACACLPGERRWQRN